MKETVITIAFIAVIGTALAVFISKTEPVCPLGTEKKLVRATWYCTVPPLK